MATSAPEKVTKRLERWQRDRIVSVLIGAVIVILAYLAVTYVYRYTHWFQQDRYMDGYGVGAGLRDDDSGGVKQDQEDCTAIAGALFDYSRDEYGSFNRSGALAFSQGCGRAVIGDPADPSEAGIHDD
jgi:hypothetical protein